MAESIQRSRGTVIRIGTTVADPSGDSFDAVADLIEITGDWGIEWDVNEFPRLTSGDTVYSKSTKSFGEVTVKLGFSDTNAGRDAFEDAADDEDDDGYNVQIELANSLGSNGTIYDFKAIITGFKIAVGDINSEVTHVMTARLISRPTTTAPAA